MLRRVPRPLRTVLLLAVVAAVSVSVWTSWTAGRPGSGGVVQTAWGPLGPADRDLLVKVRLACLWEQPTGQQAQQRASAIGVKDVGAKISSEHHALDERVRAVADQLGVLLPSAPTPQQLRWMDDLSARTGSEYDRAFTQRLREAHGAILPVIAEVRAGTRNEAVRAFAGEAEDYVSRHIAYLESTGLVDYAALPEPPSPGLLSTEAQPADMVVPALVVVGSLLLAVPLFGLLRRRDPRRRAGRRSAPAAAVPALVVPSGAPVTATDPRLTATNPRLTATNPRLGAVDPAITGTNPRISATGPRHAIRR
jgi:predicted outer membrane protein